MALLCDSDADGEDLVYSLFAGLANDAGAEQNALLEQEITTGYSRKVT
jgi:hypothetical protein